MGCVQVGSGVQWAMSEQPVDYTFWLEQGMDPTHANFLHHTCESAAGPSVILQQQSWAEVYLSLVLLRSCYDQSLPADQVLGLRVHACLAWCGHPYLHATSRDLLGLWQLMVAAAAASGGFPMSEALPMPGNMVSPNTITLKEGYTWEVGHMQALPCWVTVGLC
jgi:hypothetical protein